MAKKIYYQSQRKMDAREGVNYATTYYQQTLEQRRQLTKHLRECTKEIIDYLDQHPEEMQWHTETPLKGFPKTGRQGNRTTWEIITDIIGEAKGRKKNGDLKDYAQAPIDRWNKLFKGTDYEVEMIEHHSHTKTTFDDLWSLEQ